MVKIFCIAVIFRGGMLYLTGCSYRLEMTSSRESIPPVTEVELQLEETVTESHQSISSSLPIRSRRVIAPCSDWEKIPSKQIINSREELDTFYEAYKSVFDFSTQLDNQTDDAKNVDDFISAYDEQWFMEHKLIVIPLLAPDSGYLYEVTEAILTSHSVNGMEKGILQLSVESQREMIAELIVYAHLLFVEIDGHQFESDIKLELTFKDIPLVSYEKYYYLEYPKVKASEQPLDFTLIRSMDALNKYIEVARREERFEELLLTYDEVWFKDNILIAVELDLSEVESCCQFDRILFDKEINQLVLILRKDANKNERIVLGENGTLLVESSKWRSSLWSDETVEDDKLSMKLEIRR